MGHCLSMCIQLAHGLPLLAHGLPLLGGGGWKGDAQVPIKGVTLQLCFILASLPIHD